MKAQRTMKENEARLQEAARKVTGFNAVAHRNHSQPTVSIVWLDDVIGAFDLLHEVDTQTDEQLENLVRERMERRRDKS